MKNLKANHKSLVALLKQRADFDTDEQLHLYNSTGEKASYHYKHVYSKALEYAHHFIDMGIEEGDRIALVLPTCIEFYYCFFGAHLAGAIPFSVYPPMQLGKIDDWQAKSQTLFSIVGARLVLTNKLIHDLLVKPVSDAKVEFGLLKVEDAGLPIATETGRQPHEIAFLQYSSGSTGVPKPVAISHANAIHNANQIAAQHYKIDRENIRMVNWLPLYHDMGLVGACISILTTKGSLHLLRPDHFIGNPFIWLKTMSDAKATVTVAPNFAYGLCVRRISDEQARSLDLSSLILAGCGAEIVQPQTIEEFSEKFKVSKFNPNSIAACYGLAECTLAVTFANPGQGVKFRSFDKDALYEQQFADETEGGLQLASVGVPVDGVEISIRNDRGEVCPDGKVGTIFVKSPSVMQGYYKMTEKTNEVIQNGWFNTEDLGFLYKNELYIAGRMKDTIIINGANIDPTFIERSLLSISELRSGCYTAFSSSLVASQSSMTEDLVVVAEVSNLRISEAEKNEITIKIKKQILKDHKIKVAEVLLLARKSIPRTSSGKIKRSETKKLWQQGRLKSNKQSNIISLFKVGKAIAAGKLKDRRSFGKNKNKKGA